MMKIKRKNCVKNVTIDMVKMTKNYVVYQGDNELVKGSIYLHKEIFVKRVPTTITITIGSENE